MDFNLNNYNLKQLLDLFDIQGELTENKIKIARKKVLALHPDKTLDKNLIHYYEFFTSAFNKLVDIYSYTKSMTTEKNQRHENVDIQDSFSRYVEKNNIKGDKFSNEFNKMFEKVNIREDDGYEKWLKSNDGIYGNEDIKKARENAIILHKKNEITSFNSIDKYSDLKDTYTNTVISIDEELEFNKKKQYGSVNDYMVERDLTMRNRINYTEEQQLQMLKEQELKEQYTALQMAFEMKKKQEQSNNRLKEYYSKYLTINN